MNITINKNPVTKTSNRIGEIIQSNLPILDSSFHLADGSYLTGKIFERVRDIEQEYPGIFTCSAEDYENSLQEFGECSKYVLDLGFQQVRIPLYNSFFMNTSAVNQASQLIPEGLPNITGKFWTTWNNNVRGFHGLVTEGALYNSHNDYYAPGRITSEDGYEQNSPTNGYPWFDASKSNPIYGRSEKVQPQAVVVLTYIRIS